MQATLLPLGLENTIVVDQPADAVWQICLWIFDTFVVSKRYSIVMISDGPLVIHATHVEQLYIVEGIFLECRHSVVLGLVPLLQGNRICALWSLLKKQPNLELIKLLLQLFLLLL